MKLAAGTKLEKMRNETSGIWEDPEVQKQLKRLEAFRASFQQGILADDLTEARLTVVCLTLETSLGNWSGDVETAIRTSKVGNRRGRLAAALCWKHRMRALTLSEAMMKFCKEPTAASVEELFHTMSFMYYLRFPGQEVKQ